MGILKDIENFLLPPCQLSDTGIPSISIAYRQDPFSEIQNHVFTNAGEENTDTLYQACSISKAITSLAVAKLIDEGKLSYDSKVIEHVPESIWKDIVNPRTEHLMQYVTVGLLVSHRAGLSQTGFPGYAGEPPSYGQVLSGMPPANTPKIRFDSFPGSEFTYSGGGFVLLQILLEYVTQMPFAQLMEEMVLKPLGMNRSRFGDLPPEEDNYARAHLTAYTLGTTYSRGYHRFRELAAAGLWTTPTDLLKATAAIQKSLHYPEGFLKHTTARAMLKPVTPNDPSFSIAMGWGADNTFFAHRGGNDPGYNCYVIGVHTTHDIRLPYLKTQTLISVAVMANSAVAWPIIRKLVAAVFTLKSWPLYESFPGGFGKVTDIVPFAGPEGMFLTENWKGWIGLWKVVDDGGYGTKSSSSPNSNSQSTPAASSGDASGSSTTANMPSVTDVCAHLGVSEYELYEDEGTPMLAFEGIGEGMRLRPATIPWIMSTGQIWMAFVVDGLEVAVRFGFEDGNSAERIIELIEEKVRILRRV